MTNVRCSKCGAANLAHHRFCDQCGTSLAGGAQPQVANMRWQCRPGEVAARIDSAALNKAAKGELIVEEGTAAVILQDGKATRLDGPGRYTLQSTLERIFSFGHKTEITAFLVQSGEINLDFKLEGLWTADPLRLSASASITVQLAEIERFVQNVIKSQPTVTVRDLHNLLHPEVLDAARSFIGGQSVADLEAGLTDRREFFAVDVEERLREALAQSGLKFNRVRLFDLHHTRLDQLRGQQEELFLGPQDVANRKRLHDLHNEQEVQKIAEEAGEIARHEQRAQLWERMRRAIQADRMAEANAEEDWQKFLAEAEKHRLLRDDDLAQARELVQRAAESRGWSDDDRRRERAHALALANLFAEFERRAVQLSEQHKENRGKLDNELELARTETFGRLEIERRRVEMRLEQEAMETAHRRRQEELEAATTRELLLADALAERRRTLEVTQGWAERRRIELEIEQLEDETDLATAAKAQAMMRHNREEKLRIDRDHWIKTHSAQLDMEMHRLEIRLKEEAEVHRRQMEAKAQDQQHELARIRELSQASIEVVLSESGPEQAEFIAELKRTEIFATMSEEQILAAMMEKRPEVAEVFKAKYQAAAEGKLSAAEAEKWRVLAEMAQQHQADQHRQHDAMLDRQDRANRESAERQERLASETLRNMSDVAKAFAQKNESGPTIVFGPGGAGGPTSNPWTTGSAPGSTNSGRVQICANCLVESPVGTRFCNNCGNSFHA